MRAYGLYNATCLKFDSTYFCSESKKQHNKTYFYLSKFLSNPQEVDLSVSEVALGKVNDLVSVMHLLSNVS